MAAYAKVSCRKKIYDYAIRPSVMECVMEPVWRSYEHQKLHSFAVFLNVQACCR